MNTFWIESNWRKLLWILNFLMAFLVWGLAWVDIQIVQLTGVMTLLHTIQFAVLGLSAYALFKEQDFSHKLHGIAMKNEAIQFLKKGDLNNFKKAVIGNKSLVNSKLSNGDSLLGAAAFFGNSKMVEFLIEKGADVLKLSGHGHSPLAEAACSGSQKTYQAIRSRLNDSQMAEICSTMGISELFFAAYEGNEEKVKQLATRANVGHVILKDVTPLHMALLGSKNKAVIEHLVDLGANPNAIAHLTIRDEGVDLVDPQGFSPSMLAVLFKQVDLALFFYARNPDIRAMEGEKDHVMLACELGVTQYVEALMSSYDWKRKDRNGKTAIDYAMQVGNQTLVKKIQNYLNSGSKPQSSSQAQSAQNVSLTGQTKLSQLSIDQIENQVAMSLEGLVGFDHFIQNFSHEFHDFLKKQPGESKGIVLWGDASVGKTELGQRLAGLKQSFSNIPGLNLDGVSVKYIACCDGQIDISKEASEAEPKSIIILDEIDKFFNPKSGIVNDAEAKKLRTSIVTNFQSKPLFWIFAGTFHDLRGQNKLNEKELSQVLGTELTSRLDFADWQLPSWTLESLLTAGQSFLNRDAKIVQYDDESMVLLVQQALSSGGGVRQLQKYHDYFKREASKKGSHIEVTKTEAENYLKKLNVG